MSTPFTSGPRKRLMLPTHLAHKPILAIPYDAFDGKYANTTDASFISAGKSQWDADDNGTKEMALKVLRYVFEQDKWSRQSEEMPPHRPIDLTILLVLGLMDNTTIPAGTFFNQDQDIVALSQDLGGDFSSVCDYYSQHPDELAIIENRLNALFDVLSQWKAKRP